MVHRILWLLFCNIDAMFACFWVPYLMCFVMFTMDLNCFLVIGVVVLCPVIFIALFIKALGYHYNVKAIKRDLKYPDVPVQKHGFVIYRGKPSDKNESEPEVLADRSTLLPF